MDWLWSRRNLQQQGSKRNRGEEGEGVGLGLDKPLDFLATSGERFSARLLTSDFGNSTPLRPAWSRISPLVSVKRAISGALMNERFGMCDIEIRRARSPSGLLVDSIALHRKEAIDTCWNSC